MEVDLVRARARSIRQLRLLSQTHSVRLITKIDLTLLLTFVVSVLPFRLNEFEVSFGVAQLVFALAFVLFALLHLLILFWACFARVSLRE